MFRKDKDGTKHYRMKMDTGYIGANFQKNAPPGQKMQFNYLHVLKFPMKRIVVQAPGFKEFGIKIIQITEVKTSQVIFAGYGFTLFGTTRARLPRHVTKRMEVGLQYKITLQKK